MQRTNLPRQGSGSRSPRHRRDVEVLRPTPFENGVACWSGYECIDCEKELAHVEYVNEIVVDYDFLTVQSTLIPNSASTVWR